MTTSERGKPQRSVSLISYNIESGGQNPDGSNRIPLIKKIIRRGNPSIYRQHVVGLQETNDFDAHGGRVLKEVSGDSGYPFFALAPAGEKGKKYSVTTLSTIPFKGKPEVVKGFRNAGLVTRVNLGGRIGEVAAANIHLSPHTEAARVAELRRVLDMLKSDKHKIIMGDFNALSSRDRYSSTTVGQMNETQVKKFTDGHGHLQYEVIKLLQDAGYVDVAELFGQQRTSTVPTRRRTDKAHQLPLRIDYVFVSPSLVPFIKSYKVLKTSDTEVAADHYPVVLELIP